MITILSATDLVIVQWVVAKFKNRCIYVVIHIKMRQQSWVYITTYNVGHLPLCPYLIHH